MAFHSSIFMVVFVMIGIIAFIGVAAFIVTNNAPVDATINSSLNSYYDTQQLVNQTMNKTVQIAQLDVQGMSPMPMFAAIIFIGGALFVFLIVAKR